MRLDRRGSDEEREYEAWSKSDNDLVGSEDISVLTLDGAALLEVVLLELDDAIMFAFTSDKAFLLLLRRTG